MLNFNPTPTPPLHPKLSNMQNSGTRPLTGVLEGDTVQSFWDLEPNSPGFKSQPHNLHAVLLLWTLYIGFQNGYKMPTSQNVRCV